MNDDVLRFYFESLPAGHFLDVAIYPQALGRYRYMPHRGPGHYRLLLEFERSNLVRCTYPTASGDATLLVRYGAEYGVIVVEEISLPPA